MLPSAARTLLMVGIQLTCMEWQSSTSQLYGGQTMGAKRRRAALPLSCAQKSAGAACAGSRLPQSNGRFRTAGFTVRSGIPREIGTLATGCRFCKDCNRCVHRQSSRLTSPGRSRSPVTLIGTRVCFSAEKFETTKGLTALAEALRSIRAVGYCIFDRIGENLMTRSVSVRLLPLESTVADEPKCLARPQKSAARCDP